MQIQFTDALLYDSVSGEFFPGTLTVSDGRIAAVTPADVPAPAADQTISLGGRRVAPGLVDVHTHGRAGHDFTGADAAAMRTMAASYAKSGVTALMPTLASAPVEDLKQSTALIADLRAHGSGGARFLGVHLEGRYLNPAKRGAHNPELIAPPDGDELEAVVFRMCPPPVHVSAAFERDTSGEFLARIRALGGTAGLAHTNATFDEAMAAIARGVTSFTHLFNTMPPLHHRDPGPVCAALTTDAYVELICDGMHLHPRMVRLAYGAKKRGKFVLITDSMEATGMGDGTYSIAGLPVTVKDGRALTADGALAGSTLTLFDGVNNLVAFADISFGEALLCATRAPADMLGIDTVGDLLPGRLADFLVLSDDEVPAIDEVWLGGERYA
ncbi:MAG: N-acetylglucosamine-6-phosphate deacetylase [Clostridia bacterium]|nr:N-acetylglucosamine-6-phosphate deacetylase [Clostridia bacterium]